MVDEQRIGLVGAGSRGRSHVRQLYTIRRRNFLFREPGEGELKAPQNTYSEHTQAGAYWDEDITDLEPSVTGIFDPSIEARETTGAVCRENGDQPELFDSLGEFLDDGSYGTVIVASPNHTHAEIVLKLLDRDLNVFSEKPLATTLEDHDRIIDVSAAAPAVFYIGFNMRHSPLYRGLKNILDDGAIGRLGMISAHEVRTPFPRGHYYSQEESGGALLEKDCHDFDLFNWIIGANPVKVAALGGQHVLRENTDVNDHATVIIEYSNGVKASLELCLYAPFNQTRDRVYHARGSKGIIRTPKDEGTWDVYTRETHNRYEYTDRGGGHGGADLRQMKHFLRTLQGKDEPLASPTDAKKAAAVALAAEKSIVEDTFVTIDDNYDIFY